jgi:hypothetical protein
MRFLPTPITWLWPLIFFLLMLLSACTPSAEPPFHIRILSFSEAPVVGKVTDLVIEVANDLDRDATLVYISMNITDGVHMVKNGVLKQDPGNEHNYRLESTLKAKSQATYRVPICVTKEGRQRIIVNASEIISATSSLGETETINVINVGSTHRVVSGHDYRITPFPRGYMTPTPVPVTLPAECIETN